MKIKRTYFPMAVAIVAAIAAVACATAAKKSHDAATARNLTTFNALVKVLEENYVDTIRTDEAFRQAIGAMLSTVDPYTEYYSSDDAEQIMRMTTGEYGGIGSYIVVRDSCTYISAPYENSPAAKAGLLPGDKILFVDSIDVSSKYHPNVSKLLRGQPGTEVKVKIARPYIGPDSIMDVIVTRAKLQEPSVTYSGVVGDNTGYINLTSFITKSPDEVKDALTELLNEKKVSSLILDLRGNGGGLVESAVDILGFFLPKGTEVLSTQGSDSRPFKTYKTRHDPIVPADMPLAVLIDGGSASAAEITAGALQDLDRAVLVGSRSFGKGLVQNTLPLPYDGILKVTVAKYLLPSGRLIQALDYSRRNPDGSVARTPDSLTNIYHTRGGRIVRDGGGLTPDSLVDWPMPSSLLYQLVTDHKIFDFANKFYASGRKVEDPKTFVITDSLYSEFTSTLDPSRFTYKNSADPLLTQLKEVAKIEGFSGDEVQTLLAQVDTLFSPNLERDLKLRRKEISQYLEEEISSRYFYNKGKQIAILKNDPGLKAALDILTSPAYKRYLGSPK